MRGDVGICPPSIHPRVSRGSPGWHPGLRERRPTGSRCRGLGCSPSSPGEGGWEGAGEEGRGDEGLPPDILSPVSEQPDQHEEEVLGKAYDARLMRRLLGYIRPYKGMTVSALALILASSVFQLVGPLATAVALDLFIRPQGSTGQISAPSLFIRGQLLARGIDPAKIAVQGLAVTSIIYLTALVLTFVSLYSQGYVLQLMGQYIMKDLRRQIFAHLQ